ncbi:MAG: hypothetical protein ACLQHL_12650 [Candidatus Cybelea sp.]
MIRTLTPAAERHCHLLLRDKENVAEIEAAASSFIADALLTQ